MSYVFCILTNISAVIAVMYLAYLIYNGASVWLVAVMICLSVRFVIPANEIFTCPKCGHIDKVKVFQSVGHTLPQNEKTDE